jgi:type III pantothenate kinase
MKLLVIDIGNTNIKCGIIRDGNISERWHYETRAADTIVEDLSARSNNLPAVICSVVPRAEVHVASALKNIVFMVNRDSQKEISGLYPGFGSDRIADMIGAKRLYGNGKDVIVIGLGTATVLSTLSTDNAFKGGFITLGLGATVQALFSRIPQLPEVGLQFPVPPLPAMDTIGSIRAGTLLSQAAAIDRWIACAKDLLKGEVVTVASGGWSSTLAPHCHSIDHVDSSLTLKGSYFLAQVSLGSTVQLT